MGGGGEEARTIKTTAVFHSATSKDGWGQEVKWWGEDVSSVRSYKSELRTRYKDAMMEKPTTNGASFVFWVPWSRGHVSGFCLKLIFAWEPCALFCNKQTDKHADEKIRKEKEFAGFCTVTAYSQLKLYAFVCVYIYIYIYIYIHARTYIHIHIHRMAHEKPAHRVVDQRGRRSPTLHRKLNKCKCKVLTR
jgi:hypothetical protein